MHSFQQFFDTATQGVLKQGKPAGRQGNSYYQCLYRAPDGCKCAIGHLIPDDKYHPELENKPLINALLSVRVLELPIDSELHIFLAKLQSDHDRSAISLISFIHAYIECSRITANSYGLDLISFEAAAKELGYVP